ncbi:pectinesterase family protein [Natronoflexus pectinivorans]|nr:pectinesterase family protein [Natronoflexus pectinivorans]
MMICLLVSQTTPTENPQYHFVVSTDESGDFKSVQEAIMAVPDFRRNETIIFIKDGEYKEKLVLPASKNNVTFIGESSENTIITFDDYAARHNRFGEEMGTTGSSGFFIFGNDFTARNITFSNTAGPVGQAVAVRISGDRIIFENCRFLGYQDTLYPHKAGSRQFYKNCYIEGTVDFIFGWSTAWFENCIIFPKNRGYITAASTNEDTNHGFVFNNCSITGNAPEHSFYLGRPWRDHAQTVFLNCYMSEVVHPAGWHNWNKPLAEQTAFYAEYNSFGPGASPETRVFWSHQLTSEQAAKYSIETVLGGDDNWNPLDKIIHTNQ